MPTPSESPLSCLAPAKLNLLLNVIGRRADGYHLLQTVFRFLDWGDTVTLRARPDGEVMRTSELAGVPAEHDLVIRAARLLQAETGCRLGCEIAVEKRLPMGGGLGGGSSDAAATLIGLNRLWNLGLTRERLQSLGLRLGADVPVFVFGRSAFAEGIGERLQPVELAAAWYVVLQPPVSVPTADIFAAPELTRDSKPIKMQGFSAGAGRNDLEAVVCRRHPEVARYLAWLRQFGAAAMTGSGGCVFAAFETERAAREVLDRLPGDMTGCAARGIDRHPMWEWLQ